eukprot:TRINITY_DN13331_c0_g1_i5.p1 TRINITY_DN13331_c0_g1~~TRINITY_DN13331_c0_g1_i5.p1  ORF type:complete len:442 (+),score=105.12 TRINITY_DN13331_c0_g1_i5:179-1504(+)
MCIRDRVSTQSTGRKVKKMGLMSTWVLVLVLVLAGRGDGGTLESLIEDQMDRGKIPGLSAVVLSQDKLVWSGHFGSTLPNSTDGPAVSATTVFELASLSKTTIGVAAMLLMEKELLHPSDPISDHIGFDVYNPHFPDEAITVHGLLTHTSSILDAHYNQIDSALIYSRGDPHMSLDEFLFALLDEWGDWYSSASFSRRHPPQRRYAYSNVGSTLAAYLVETVAKKAGLASTFDEFVRKHVFAPLGVHRAGFFVKGLGGERGLVPPMGAVPSSWVGSKKRYESYCFYNFPDYPDGALKISAMDYAKMFGAVINDGEWDGVRLLNHSSVGYIKRGKALFYHEEREGRWMLGHNGGEMGIATEAFFNVDTGVGFVVIATGDWGDGSSAFDRSFAAIEKALMERFDPVGGSEEGLVEQVTPLRWREGHRLAQQSQARECPCGLPC